MSRQTTVRLARFLIIRLAASCALAFIASPQAWPRELPLHAIVDGHTVQPRDAELQALGHPDLTAPQQREVDELYQQVLRNSRSVSTGQS
jgi:hypothetical protein